MSIGFMVTDGGPHPPEKWADTTTRAISDLIVIEPSAPTQAIVDKRDFEAALFRVLVDLHQQMQEAEKASIKADGLLKRIDPTKQAHAAADRLVAVAAGTRFAEHFAKAEVRDHIYRVVGQHFADAMHIERSWHADRNPDDAASKEFRAKHSALEG